MRAGNIILNWQRLKIQINCALNTFCSILLPVLLMFVFSQLFCRWSWSHSFVNCMFCNFEVGSDTFVLLNICFYLLLNCVLNTY